MFPRLHPVLLASFALAAGLAPMVMSAQTTAGTLDRLEVTAPRPAGAPATTTHIALEALPTAPTGLSGLAASVPNFFSNATGARGFGEIFALRGLVNTPYFGAPAVAVYLDDMPLGSAFTFPSSLLGFAAAELHRGPGQGTAFGRAGPGGVLRLSTPRLAGAGLAGEARATYGNFAAVGGAGLISAANERTDLLVVLAHDSRNGYIYNTTLGRDIDGKDAQSALARLHWRPADGIDLTLLATGLRARDGVQPLVPLGGPLYTSTRSKEGQSNLDSTNLALTAGFATEIGRLSATTSHYDWDLNPYTNQVVIGGFLPFDTDLLTLRQRGWSEEVRLVSDEKAAVRWSGGVFFSDVRGDSTVIRSIFGPFEDASAQTKARSLAVFTEATFKVGDALTFTPGLRAESNRKNFTRTERFPAPGTVNLKENSTALLPKIATNYILNPQTTLFASVGAGYKPGGFSSFTSNPAFMAFGPERTTAFEAGLTRESADHAYTATARAFWYDIKGYQIERAFGFGGDYFVVNAPRARSIGAELELAWRPAAGIMVGGSVGYTHVELRRFTDPFTLTTFDGNRAPYVPLYDASLRVEYRHDSGWFFGVEGSATGRVFYSEGEDPVLTQRPYALLAARLGWENRRWRVSVRGDNLTGQEYYSSMTPIAPGSEHGTPGAPRTYGLDVTVKF
jgi:outer membrane receptor protein involved in Fe transport